MNKYEELLQATEPARNLLRAQYDPMCEIRITSDRVDVLRGEMGLPFEAARQDIHAVECYAYLAHWVVLCPQEIPCRLCGLQ